MGTAGQRSPEDSVSTLIPPCILTSPARAHFLIVSAKWRLVSLSLLLKADTSVWAPRPLSQRWTQRSLGSPTTAEATERRLDPQNIHHVFVAGSVVLGLFLPCLGSVASGPMQGFCLVTAFTVGSKEKVRLSEDEATLL